MLVNIGKEHCFCKSLMFLYFFDIIPSCFCDYLKIFPHFLCVPVKAVFERKITNLAIAFKYVMIRILNIQYL